MHCAAAPIRDIHGKLAGVLDMSSEGIAFNFDAASVAGLYASSIENRLLVSQSAAHLIVRFQISPAMLDTPMAGLMGVDMQGRIVWRNAAASRLLGILQFGYLCFLGYRPHACYRNCPSSEKLLILTTPSGNRASTSN